MLRPGGRITFFTAVGDPAATPVQREQFFPDSHAVAEEPYPEMMAAAGFVDVTCEDMTGEYLATAAAGIAAAERLADRLRDALGPEVFAAKQERRQRMLAAGRAGLVTRILVTGRRAG